MGFRKRGKRTNSIPGRSASDLDHRGYGLPLCFAHASIAIETAYGPVGVDGRRRFLCDLGIPDYFTDASRARQARKDLSDWVLSSQGLANLPGVPFFPVFCFPAGPFCIAARCQQRVAVFADVYVQPKTASSVCINWSGVVTLCRGTLLPALAVHACRAGRETVTDRALVEHRGGHGVAVLAVSVE